MCRGSGGQAARRELQLLTDMRLLTVLPPSPTPQRTAATLPSKEEPQWDLSIAVFFKPLEKMIHFHLIFFSKECGLAL